MKKLLNKIFKNRNETITELFVIFGEQNEDFNEPNYSTNPLDYGLNLSNSEKNLEEKCKAFINAEDAINFAYHCNLVSVVTVAYKLKKGIWVSDPKLTNKKLDIDW
jgi:hypothetical protein